MRTPDELSDGQADVTGPRGRTFKVPLICTKE